VPLKFRLKGLAETFVDAVVCPCCKNDGGESGDEGFATDLSRVTFDGIIAVIECTLCDTIFVPDSQRLGILDQGKLRQAVEHDSTQSGEPLYQDLEAVRLDVERLNALREGQLH